MSSAWSASDELRPPTNPLTRGFTPVPHWVLRCQTHTIATAKQSCVCTEIYIFLWKCTKSVATRATPFGSDRPMHQIVWRLGLCPRPHWVPRPIAGSGGGAPGEKEGRRGEGKEGGEGQALQGRQAGRVPECPNPELASLSTVLKIWNAYWCRCLYISNIKKLE